jgi:hypothetical protein
MNIWTHLLGAIFFLSLFFMLIRYQQSAKDFTDKIKEELVHFYNKSNFKKKFFYELEQIVRDLKNKAEQKNKSVQQIQ